MRGKKLSLKYCRGKSMNQMDRTNFKIISKFLCLHSSSAGINAFYDFFLISIRWRLIHISETEFVVSDVLFFSMQKCHNLADNCRGADSARLSITQDNKLPTFHFLSLNRQFNVTVTI